MKGGVNYCFAFQNKNMTILKKLHEIENKKCIYDIHYCRAGVGFIFYYPKMVRNLPNEIKNIGGLLVDTGRPENWRQGLQVDRYYPTFEKAVEGEYKKLKLT